MNLKYFDPASPPHSLNEALFGDTIFEDWQMTAAERYTLISILSELKPDYAIEIGTAQGGSLSVIARFSKKVYSLDINSRCAEQLGPRFANVEFVTGESQKTLPPLISQLQQSNVSLSFALVDGGHSAESVKQDIKNLLTFKPIQPFYILMHDSFNPDCRRGMVEVDWAANPYVHFVEFDFVPGVFLDWPEVNREMWGGFALALLLPYPATAGPHLNGNQLMFETLLTHSAHTSERKSRHLQTAISSLRKKIKGS